MAEAQDTPEESHHLESLPRPKSLWQIMRPENVARLPATAQNLEPIISDMGERQVVPEEPATEPESSDTIFVTAEAVPPLRSLWNVMREPEEPNPLPAPPPFRSLQRQPVTLISPESTDATDRADSRSTQQVRRARWDAAGVQFRKCDKKLPRLSRHVMPNGKPAKFHAVDEGALPETIEPNLVPRVEFEPVSERLTPVTTAWVWMGRGGTSTLAAYLFSPLAKFGSLWWELPATIFGFGGLVCACLAMTEAERRLVGRTGPHGESEARRSIGFQLFLAALLVLAATGSIFIGPFVWG